METFGVKRLTKLSPLTLLGLILFASLCSADHLPPELQAKGKPEKRLAGIHIDNSKTSSVIRMYGKPSEAKKQDMPADPNVLDAYDNYWIRPRTKLHLFVYRGKAKAANTSV